MFRSGPERDTGCPVSRVCFRLMRGRSVWSGLLGPLGGRESLRNPRCQTFGSRVSGPSPDSSLGLDTDRRYTGPHSGWESGMFLKGSCVPPVPSDRLGPRHDSRPVPRHSGSIPGPGKPPVLRGVLTPGDNTLPVRKRVSGTRPVSGTSRKGSL